MSSEEYTRLVITAKNGNRTSYNTLCTEFLGYVPLIIEDLSILIHGSHLDHEDIEQEGYVVICESIGSIINSGKYQTTELASKFIIGNLISTIMKLISEQREYEEHEIAAGINKHDPLLIHLYQKYNLC